MPRQPTISDPRATIDTIGVALPVDDFDRVGCKVSIDNYMQPGEAFKYSRPLAGGGFLATGIGNMAWVEASLPKRIDGENFEAVELEPALELLSALVDEARGFLEVPAGHLFEECKVVRLDLVRDFHECKRTTELLDGLAAIDQPGRAKVRRFADPSANRAETLRVGPRAWGCTLYDKHAETGGKAPEGQVRYEARLHQDQLTSVFQRNNGGHFRTVGDLIRVRNDGIGDGGTALARAQRAWFERVGFDRECTTRDALSGRLAALELRPVVAAGLWTYLTAPAIRSGWSRNTVRKYRNMADDFGLAPALADRAETYRLDYDAGSLRVAA